MAKLEINLIPKTSFFTNLRSELPKSEWDRLRKSCYKNANYLCEICGGKGPTHPVECHEVWDYNPKTKIQRLVKLIALCPACHEVNHIGLAEVRGRLGIALKHLMRVNGWSQQEALAHRAEAFRVWNDRNLIEWKLDLSVLTQPDG